MKKLSFRRGGPPWPSLVAAVLLFGCASSSDHDAAYQQTLFQQRLTLTTEAISSGELETARMYLTEARSVASTAPQERKIESLEYLIEGIEALREGDPMVARTEWSKIQHPTLSREVRHKARLIGITVPVVPDEEAP